MKRFTTIDLKAMLLTRTTMSTQKRVASDLGVSAQFLNDVIAGRRDISENLANALGFTKLPNAYIRKQQ